MTTEDGVTLTATEWSVTATEKVSTGEYENAEYHTTIGGEVDGGAVLDADTRRELKARLLAVHKVAQEMVTRSGENRVGDEVDWGVYYDRERSEP